MNKFEVVNKNTTVENLSSWIKIRDDGAFYDIIDGWNFDIRDTYYNAVEKYSSFGRVIQAGGYFGIFPALMAQKFESVYTFEPDPDNFYCLGINTAPFDNVIKLQAALGESPGFVAIDRPINQNRGMNRVGGPGLIPVMTIDSFEFDSCDFIQLDVEGYELHIIRGAMETIRAYSPVISIEDTNPEIEKLLITSLGYSIVGSVYRDTIYAKSR